MDTRQAILKAADHIEANPGLYSFHKVHVPNCGTPGCALGWICFFAGQKHDPEDVFHVESVLGIGSGHFYLRMSEFNPDGDWMDSHKDCARNLRLYADKYHPADDSTDPAVMAEVNRILETARVAEA